jgi:AcrR family transcriptional regulator
MKSARDRILSAADRIHRTRGVSELSLRAVAREVGVTPMAIYRHFTDKDALLMALVEAGFAKLEAYLAGAVRARTPLKAIERCLLAYANFALAEPNAFELMFLIRRPDIPAAPDSLRTSPSPSIEALIAAVREVMEAGNGSGNDPGEVILMCWATSHGLITLHFTGRFGHDDARFRTIYGRVVKRLLALSFPHEWNANNRQRRKE